MRKMINTILAVVAMLIAAAHARIGPTSLQTLRAVQTTGKGPSISSANAVDATGITAGGVTFKNAKAREYYVDGRTIPLMDFDIGPLFSGLLPISAAANETRKLFFIFTPTQSGKSSKDLVIWLNGGPGCSSLEGWLQENGPATFGFGQAAPTLRTSGNWAQHAHMLHVEQMVGSGFSQGPVTVTNDDELAVMFIGFMQQFLLLFPEMNGFSLYMTGESYAGYHASYISKNIVQQPAALNLTFRGLMLFDPSLHYDIIQEQAPALPFARYWQDIMRLNDTTLATLQTQSDRCGYTNFFDQLTYPPSKALTFPNGRTTATEDCDIFSAIINAALVINPAFNIYDILDISVLSDPLGLPGTFPSQQFPFSAYFNIEAVKQVLHAPNITWETCASGKVYATPSGYGTNAPSTFEALPIVLNAGKRVIIGHGALDYVLMQNGTRFAIQNMTWQNRQGFQQPIGSGLFYTGAQGSVGNVHEERGLTYVEPYLSGHMVPQFQPLVAVKMLTYLLGQIDTIVGK